MATYRSVVGPAVDNLEEAMERSKATQADRALKLEAAFNKPASERLAARKNDVAQVRKASAMILRAEIKGEVGRSEIYRLRGGGFATVIYSD